MTTIFGNPPRSEFMERCRANAKEAKAISDVMIACATLTKEQCERVMARAMDALHPEAPIPMGAPESHGETAEPMVHTHEADSL